MDTTQPTMQTSYCAEQVRLLDRDRYLTALFAPDARREALFALYAFNLEISRVRETVSEKLIGEMRLQWWREALEAIYSGAKPPAHPVAEALAAAVAMHRLEHEPFARLIDGRARDLDDQPPADMPALIRYAEDTSIPLIQLALGVLDAVGGASMKAAEGVGTGYALTGLLRAVPFHAAQKRLYLPRSLCEEVGLETGRLFELKPDPALPPTIKPVAAEARAYLVQARRQVVPRAALPALLPAVVADAALNRLEQAGFNPFDARVARRDGLLPLALAWRAKRGRF